jgi:hypothetical protein
MKLTLRIGLFIGLSAMIVLVVREGDQPPASRGRCRW